MAYVPHPARLLSVLLPSVAKARGTPESHTGGQASLVSFAGGQCQLHCLVSVSVTVAHCEENDPAVTTDRAVSYTIGAARFELATSRTPCRIHALTGAGGRWFMRVSGWIPLTSSSQQQWALSLTLTLFGTPERA